LPLGTLRALPLAVLRALLGLSRALLGPPRALSGSYRELLGPPRALLGSSRALLGAPHALRELRCCNPTVMAWASRAASVADACCKAASSFAFASLVLACFALAAIDLAALLRTAGAPKPSLALIKASFSGETLGPTAFGELGGVVGGMPRAATEDR
jgi:hypothetical protein